ncbi:MAG: holo-ACP synthase [Solirubrobacteraceae bacterium]
MLVGTDLVAVSHVREAVDAFASRYLDRVYTPRELADCRLPGGGHDPARLAARFAAKEATLKALRAGDAAIPWTAVEVAGLPDGAPSLRLRGAAAALATSAGAGPLAVSLAHEGEFATAVVVAGGVA